MKKTILAAAFVVGLSTPALADDTGFYVGGSVGWAYMDVEPSKFVDDSPFDDFNFDDDDFGYKVFAGWQILSLLAIEGGYVDFGEVEDSTPVGRTRVSTDAWDLFVVGNVPLGFVDLFAKIGVVDYDTEVKLRGDSQSFNGDESGTEAAYGIGAALELGSFAVRGEWEYFDASELKDLSMFSVGLTYQF